MEQDQQGKNKSKESPFNWPRANDLSSDSSGVSDDEKMRQNASKYPEPNLSDLDLSRPNTDNKPAYPGRYDLRNKVAVPPSARSRLLRFLRKPRMTDIKNRYRFNRFI